MQLQNTRTLTTLLRQIPVCHGVGLIANAERILVKVIWTVILLTLCGVLVWQIVVLFVDYYKYTPVTEVRIEVRISYFQLIGLNDEKLKLGTCKQNY